MEKRKEKEIEYYDKRAEEFLKEKSEKKWQGDFEGFQPQNLESFRFLYKLLKENCQGKIVLDYGCGNGVHSTFPVKMGAKKVIGIDLSEKSLKIAKEKAKREGVAEKVEFLKMDCEEMEFPDNFFDIVFDGGTFSSLDLKSAFPEIVRVLKPEGEIICDEPISHNPFFQLYRKLTPYLRTKWEMEHILSKSDIRLAEKYFGQIETKFFHLATLAAVPLRNLPGFEFILKLLEAIDSILLKLPFLKWWAWQIVFILSEPKKISF